MTRSGLVKIAVLCIVLFGLPSLFPGPLGGAAKAALVASPSAVTSTTAQGTNAQAPEATSTGPSPGAPLARTEAPSVSPRVADARAPATDYGQSSGDPIYYFTTTDASGKLYDMKTTGVAGATTIQDLVPSVDGTPQSGTTTTASLSIGSFATTSYPDVVILWIVTYLSGSSVTVSTSTPPTATGVTFQSTPRASLVSCSSTGADETTETEWWGTTTAAISSESITVTLSAAPTHAIGYAMAFRGVNVASPFDSHTGLPATGVSATCGTAADPTATGLETSNSDDLIVNFFGGNTAAETLGTIAGSTATSIEDASHADYSTAAESLVVTTAELSSQSCVFSAATSTFFGDVCDALVAAPTPTYSIVPDATTSVIGTPSESAPSNDGWETTTLSGASILSGAWSFDLTTTASAASGTAYVWVTVWNCTSSSGGCTFLFKNYDNSTNILATTVLTTNAYTTGTEGPFYNVDFLRVEYWIVYASVGTSTTSTITETSAVSSDSEVVVPTLGASWPITVATPTGGTAFPYTIGGCSVSPTSGTSGSTPADFTATASCALTITMPAAGSNTRYVFASSASTYSTSASCTTLCTNPSPSDYYQLGNTLEISANAQTDFDTGMTALTIKGTVAGVASTTICTITITAATSDNCSTNPAWSDYDTAATGFTNPISGAPSHSRWGASTTCTYTFTTYGTGDCQYYKQWEFEPYYTIEDAGTGYSPPVLNSTQYGSSYTPSLGTASGTVYWLDNGATWSITNPLSGSTGTEQWNSDTIASFSGTVSSTSPITAGTTAKNLLYYNQYPQTLSYSVVDGGAPTAPTATGTSLGVAYAPTLTQTATAYWFDASGSIAFSTPTATNEQWAPSPSSLSATSSNTQVVGMYNQYKHTLSYAVVNGGSPSAPTASGMSLGSSYTPTLPTTASAFWFDASGSVVVSTPTNGATERWSPSPSSLSPTSSNTQVFSLYNQYSQTLSYGVNDGGSGYSAPSTVGGLQLGSSYSPTLSTTATGYWFDATGTLTFANPLTCVGGCPSGERWSENSASKSLTSTNTQTVQYYNQYEPNVSYLAENGGAPTGNALVLSYSSFGSGTVYTLTTTPTGEWIDAASYTVGDHYASSTERYSQNQNGTLWSPTAMVFEIYHQFAATSSYSGTVGAGGAPSLSGSTFGSGNSATLLTASATPIWLDSGSSYFVTKPSADFPSSTERYETSFANGTIISAVTVDPVFYHQFDAPANYSTSDESAIPGGDGSVTLTAVQFGSSVTPALTTTAASYWLDSGSSWSVTPDVLPASPSGERWDANNVGVSGSVSSSTAIAPDYLHQYLLTVTGGNGVTYGTASPTSDSWYDAGSSTTVSSNWVWNTVSGQSRSAVTNYQIDGVSQNPTRADSGALTTASVTFNAAHTVAFLSTTQYYLTVDGGGGVSYGTPSPTGDNWYDSGASTTVSSNGVYGRASGTGQRVSSWNVDGGPATSVATTGTVTTSTVTMSTYHAVNFSSVTQYFLSDNDPSGSESSVTAPAISGDTGWYDSGTAVTIVLNNVYGLVPDSSRNNLLSYTQAGNTTPVTRSGSGTATESTIDMSAPTTVSATYVVQYYLAISTDCYGADASVTSPTGDGWYDSGTSLNVQCSGISSRTGGSGKRAQDYYWDSASKTSEATIGTYATSSVTMNSAHTLNVDAVVQFQVSFAASPMEGGSASTSTAPPISGDAGWYDSGSVISITADPDTYWSFSSWSASAGSIALTSSSAESTTATISGTGTITAEFTVTTPLSAGNVSPASPAIDQGQTITLGANPSGGTNSYAYQWYTASGCSSPISGANSATYAVSPSTSTTYYYEVTDSSSSSACSAGDTVTVSPAPTVSISPTSVTMDDGQSVAITATPSHGTGTFAYSWSVASGSCPGFSDSGGATLTYSPSGATGNCVLKVTLTDTGTSGQATPLATATPSTDSAITVDPAVSVSVSPQTIDQEQTAGLTAVASGGSGLYATFSWYSGASCTGTPLQSGVLDVLLTTALTLTTSYCVTVIDSLGGTASTTVTVTLSGALSIMVSPVSIDSGQVATLTGVASGGSGTYPDYSWYSGSACDGTPLQTGSSDSYTTASLTSTTTYCIQVTDSRGGTATTTATVTINPALSVSIAPMSVDSGQTATLTAVATGGSGTYALYTWYSGESCSGAPLRSGSSGSYTTAPLVAEAAYCVQVTDSLGGTTTGVVAVTINPALSVSVSPTTIDQGQTASLTADASGGSGSYSTFAWFVGDSCTGTPLQSTASHSFTTASLTTDTGYCIQVTDSLGGAATSTVTVTVNPALSVSVSPVTVDFNQTALLTAVASGGSGSYTVFAWYLGDTCTGTPAQSAASSYYMTSLLTTTAGYCVAVTDSLGGTATTTVFVTVSGVLSDSVSPITIDSGQTAALTATASGGSGSYVEYDWYLGDSCTGTPLQSNASDAYTAAALSSSTDYCIVVTDSLGSNATTTVTVTVNAPLSISVSPASVDSGQSASLTAITSEGSGSYVSYAWYSGASCTGTPLQTGPSSTYATVALTSNTGYCVQVTDSLGSTATGTATVTINPSLSVSVSPVSVDSGQSGSLRALATGGSASYSSYTWYLGNACSGSPLQSGSSASYTTASLTSQAEYCVMLADSLGGTAATTVIVTVNPALLVSVSPATVDSGQAAVLTADATGGSGSYALYTWYSGEACSGTPLRSSSSPSFSTGSLSSSAAYCVVVTDSVGGVATDTVTVAVEPALTAPVVSASPTAVTSGESAALSTTSSFSGGASPYACQWLVEAPGGGYVSLGASFTCTLDDLPATSTGALATLGTWSFVLRVTDSTWATSTSAPATISVAPPPNPSSVSVTCTPSVVAPDLSVDCTATVTGASPTGTVSFTTTVGSFAPSSTCTLESGSCSVTFVAPPASDVAAITASYSGDSSNGASSGVSSVSVPSFAIEVPGGAAGASISGPTGSSITMSGYGFAASIDYYYCFEAGASSAAACGSNQDQLVTDSSGSIPSSTGLGGVGSTGLVVVYDPASGAVVGWAQYTAISPASGPSAPSITISPPSGTVQTGAQLTVTGTNFGGGATITFAYSGGVLVVDSGTITASPTGGFTATATILAGQPGSFNLAAIGSDAPSDAASASYALTNVNGYVSASLTVPSSGTATVDQTSTTGVNVTVQDAPNASGQVTISNLGAPATGVAPLSLSGTKYYDVLVTNLPGTASAGVCITDASITSSTTLYWAPRGRSFVVIASIFTAPDTLCTSAPVFLSQLGGTNFAIGTASTSGGGGGPIYISQSIRLTSATGDGPVDFSLSGCGVAPSVVEGDGQAHHIAAYPGCTVTVSPITSGGAYTRSVFARGNQTLEFTTCRGLGCSSSLNATYFVQVLETLCYSVTGGAAGSSAPVVEGFQFGSAYSVALASTPEWYWLDASGGMTLPSLLPGSGAQERWSLVSMSAGILSADTPHTLLLVYAHQYSVVLTVSPKSAGTTTPPGPSWLNASSTFTISAVANSGYSFSGWVPTQGVATLTNRSAASTTFVVTGAGMLTATFALSGSTSSSSTSSSTSMSTTTTSSSTSSSTASTTSSMTSVSTSFTTTTATSGNSTTTTSTLTPAATGGATPTAGALLAGAAAAIAAMAILVLPKTRRRRQFSA